MTLKEIADVASVLIGKQIDTSLANIYLTEGLLLLTAQYPTACPVKCVRVIVSDPETPVSIPQNKGIYKIYREKSRYLEYHLDEIGLFVSHQGEYLVYYYQGFSGRLSENENIPVAPEYEGELCKYVAFSVLRSDDPSNRLADKLVEEFYDNCAAIHSSMTKKARRKPASIQAPKWR
ncbi:MAG: hypothetical protein IJ278_04760 [Clostridia bacterium]|nr:hypothetical protein [Clostridia bacterium]